MWVGGYELQLYCDCTITGGHKIDGSGKLTDALGHNYDEFPHIYTGERGADCRARARKTGWTIGRTGNAVCPKCNKAKVL